MKNEQIVLAKFPDGLPEKDDFRYESTDIKQPINGEVLVETAYLSMDPYMRNGMRKDPYVASFKIDEPMYGRGIGKVIESKDDRLKKGMVVKGVMPWKRYNTLNGDELEILPKTDVPYYLYLSVLGATGQTAYHGLLEIGKPKAGETVVVSAASGAVGSVASQIAKIKGCYVVGIAGGKEKTHYLIDELGLDKAVDYKSDDFKAQLKEAVPNGVDIYYENVGGMIANEVMQYLNSFARIPVCGSISKYNDKAPTLEPPIQPILIKHQALMQGFLVNQFKDDFERAGKELAQWVKEGKIKAKSSIIDGFDQVPRAFHELFTGQNFGKQIVKVSNVIDE